MNLKLCNSGKSVFGTDDSGNTVSYSIKAEEYMKWLSEGNTPEPEFTDEELISIDKLKLDKLVSDKRDTDMLLGSTYTINGVDYIVSFTKDDGDGLVQVKNSFDLGLESTNIHFVNKTIMPINSINFLEFAKWFVTERNKFFI